MAFKNLYKNNETVKSFQKMARKQFSNHYGRIIKTFIYNQLKFYIKFDQYNQLRYQSKCYNQEKKVRTP